MEKAVTTRADTDDDESDEYTDEDDDDEVRACGSTATSATATALPPPRLCHRLRHRHLRRHLLRHRLRHRLTQSSDSRRLSTGAPCAVRSQEDEDDDEPGDFDESEPVPTASSLSADPGERPLGIMVCPPVESRPPCHRHSRPKRLVGPGWPPPEAARGIPARP